jgi:uncharacterized protein YbcI
VVVQDAFTPAERTLVSDGEANVVLSARKAFHATLRVDLVAGVEQLTDRAVIAFFSEDAIDPEIALASFLLASVVASTRTSRALAAISPVDPAARR